VHPANFADLLTLLPMSLNENQAPLDPETGSELSTGAAHEAAASSPEPIHTEQPEAAPEANSESHPSASSAEETSESITEADVIAQAEAAEPEVMAQAEAAAETGHSPVVEEENSPAEAVPQPSMESSEPTLEAVAEEMAMEEVAHAEEHHEESVQHLSRKELLDRMRQEAAKDDPASRRNLIQSIREAFIILSREEQQRNLERYLEDGGVREEYEAPADALGEEFHQLDGHFRAALAEQARKRDKQLQENLRLKKLIIEDIRSLVDSSEINKQTFDRLHELQEKWRETGMVPQADSDNIWKTYRFHTDKFYEKLKINNELRELDHKKNLAAKTEICDKAEELLVEPGIGKAMEGIRALQIRWKETGPVARDVNETIWQRFSSACDKIFARQREFMESRKSQQEAAKAAKEALIEAMQELLNKPAQGHKEWMERSQESEQLMERWKQIGFASREINEGLWKTFRELRDQFFKSKESYYNELRATLSHNLKLKQDMCDQVEKLSTSTDWRNTTNVIRKIQDEWKTVGPVPRKHADKVWGRFRKACDAFFESKKLHFADSDAEQQRNLEAKQELIARIEAFQLLENNQDTIQALKAFQAEWMGIGHVPFKQKESLNNRYRAAIDKQFDSVRGRVGEHHRAVVSVRYEEMGRQKGKLQEERGRLGDKIKRLHQEIAQLENNMGFFAKSKGADTILKEVRGKIEAARQEINRLKDQQKLIDGMRNSEGKPAPELPAEAHPQNESAAETSEASTES
jgi:hypothetical protein